MLEGHLWLAGKQLTKLAILPTENQLSVRSMERDYHGDAFDNPLQAVGKLVISVRRPAKRAGAVVTATDSAAGRPAWETDIAMPLAGAPAIDAARVGMSAATASGAVYLLDRQAMVRGVQDQSALRPPSWPKCYPRSPKQSILAPAVWPSPRRAQPKPSWSSQTTPLSRSGRSTSAARWQRRSSAGAMASFFQPTLGRSSTSTTPAAVGATPFQPELTPDRKYKWLAPATVGEGADAKFVLSDGAEKVYLIGLVSEPTPHLEALKSVDVGPAPLPPRSLSLDRKSSPARRMAGSHPTLCPT